MLQNIVLDCYFGVLLFASLSNCLLLLRLFLTDGTMILAFLSGSTVFFGQRTSLTFRCAYPRELKGVPLNYVEKYKTTAQQRKRLLVVALFVVALVLTIAITIYCLRKIRAGEQGYNSLGTQRLILDDDVVKPEDV